MAHFAKLNSNNEVLEVHYINNEVLKDSNGIEQENIGIEFLKKIHNYDNWVQTSYNANFRKNYAGVGYIYDKTRDAFIPPKPYSSFTLNEITCLWDAPIKRPDIYEYNEIYVVPKWNENYLRWEGEDNNNNRYLWDPTSYSWSPL